MEWRFYDVSASEAIFSARTIYSSYIMPYHILSIRRLLYDSKGVLESYIY